MSSQVAKVVVFLGALGIATYVIVTRLGKDPEGDARRRVEQVIEKAKTSEAAAKALDDVLTAPDFAVVPAATQVRAGLEVIRLAAARPNPDTAERASRLVRRYQLLPPAAQGELVLDELVSTLEMWADQQKDLAELDTKIALLRQAKLIAGARQAGVLAQKLATAKLEAARQKLETQPLEALSLLVQEPIAATAIDEAGRLLATLVQAPSLLDEAGRDIDLWLAATKETELAAKVRAARELAQAARADAEQEKTPEELAALQKQRPWDQRIALRLALHDLDAGKPASAEARLQAFGKPALLVRDARMLLARIAMQQGKVAEAEALIATLLGARLQQFVAASAEYEQVANELQADIEDRLKTGRLPLELTNKLEHASEDEQRRLVQDWIGSMTASNQRLAEKREAVVALGDVVTASIFAGTLEVQRAQALSGAERDKVLADAEKVFLAVRVAAEGQPEYHLGLGEIYARLGKVAESDKELQAVLDRKELALTLAVANVYRNIGNDERGTAIAKALYEQSTVPADKQLVAYSLFHLARGDEDRERWLRASDPDNAQVKISLLELEAGKQRDKGDFAACDRAFAEAAKAHLALAAQNEAGYNNAALAHLERFSCTGDLGTLRDAEKVLERAYRGNSGSPIVVFNYASVLESNAFTRALAKRIDLHALRLTGSDLATLATTVMDGADRSAMLADLALDPAWKKSEQIYAQAEVLLPNSTTPYWRLYQRASWHGDVKTAMAVVDRLRRAPKLDTSETVKRRTDRASGADDANRLKELDTAVARFERLAAQPGLTPRSLAAVQLVWSRVLGERALLRAAAADAAKTRELATAAVRAWPALGVSVPYEILDEIGLRLGGAAWAKQRRERSAVELLDKLAAAKDPLVATIQADPAWPAIAPLLRELPSPSFRALRLARHTADAQAIAKHAPALDDPFSRLDLEVEKIIDPGQASTDEAFAVLAAK